MIYLNADLKSKLENLVLVGQDYGGELEWIGRDKEWEKSESEAKLLSKFY